MDRLNIQMKKGEYLLIYGGYSTSQSTSKSHADSFFGKDISELYDHIVFEDYFYTTMQGGNDSYTLES